jgi:hypothetical protein
LIVSINQNGASVVWIHIVPAKLLVNLTASRTLREEEVRLLFFKTLPPNVCPPVSVPDFRTSAVDMDAFHHVRYHYFGVSEIRMLLYLALWWHFRVLSTEESNLNLLMFYHILDNFEKRSSFFLF